MLPSADLAMTSIADVSNTTSSVASTPAMYSVIICGEIFFSWNCKHRESTVTGTFLGSVVARRNFTCSGGSSNVFSNALKLAMDSM